MSMRATVPICNSMYSFHRLMKAGKLDTLGVPKLCADLGIELLEVNPTYLPTDEPGLQRFERALEEAGCGVLQMTCDFPLCRMDEAERKATVEEVRRWAEMANRLGAATIRCNIGRKFDEDMEQGTGEVVRSFKEIVSFCKDLGLVAVIENTHGPHTGNADAILRIIEEVGSDSLGTCPDFGNFPEDVRYDSLLRVAPYAAHVHAKTLKLDAKGNETTYDLPRCVQIFREIGYQGAWGIEFEGEFDEVVADEIAGVRMTRQLLESLL